MFQDSSKHAPKRLTTSYLSTGVGTIASVIVVDAPDVIDKEPLSSESKVQLNFFQSHIQIQTL